jgi:hypothetical protein
MVKRKSVDAGLEEIEVKVKKVTMRGKKDGMFPRFACFVEMREDGCLALAQVVGERGSHA